jgi:hypothetical protein
MNQKLTSTQSQPAPIIINQRPLTWLEHAQRHHDHGYNPRFDAVVSPVDNHLMYLCIMANEGMFD